MQNDIQNKKILLVDLPWRGKKYAGRAGMRWAHTSNKEPILSFRPFPFYLGCTAAVLENAGYSVKVIDALAENLDEFSFIEKVKEYAPDFIIAETHTPSYNNDKYFMEVLKKETNAKLILAGPHATALPEETHEETKKYVDYVLAGEYEFLTLDVVEGRKKGPVVKLEKSVDINTIPWPARHLFKMNLYNEVFCRNYPNIQLMGSRGCPYRCSYCSIYQMSGERRQRVRDPKNIIEEIKFIIKTYKPRELYFDDDNIDANPKWFEELLDLKIKENIKIPFTCMGHVNIKPELLEKMKKAHCVGIKLGIESTNNEVLKRLGKGMTKEMAEKTIKKCRDVGIKTHLTFCVGLPGDTEQTVNETVDFAKKQGDNFQISIATPFPKTPFWNEAEKEGWLDFKSWDDFDGMDHSIINYPHLSSEKMKKIVNDAQKYTYKKTILSGEWIKFVRMIYQERGLKGLTKLAFIRGPGMAKDAFLSKVKPKKKVEK